MTFEDPEAVKDFFSSMKDVTCTFSVEITPCIKHVSSFVLTYFLVISFFFIFQGSIHYLKYDRPGMTYKWSPRKSKPNGDTEMVQLEDSQSNKTKFKDIDTQLEYTFRVCTLINGKKLSRKLETLKPQETPEEQ